MGNEPTHAGDAHVHAFGFTITTSRKTMGKIPKHIIEKILDTAKIKDVVEDILGPYSSQNRTGLKKKGVRYTAICPFHDDRHNGNFMVYPKGNCFKCFVCGVKGGCVDFIMKHEGLTYPDAIRWLGKKYNIETDMTDFNYTPPPPKPAPPPLATLELPMSMVTERERLDDDTLVQWIRQQPWDYMAQHRVEDVLKAYHVGHAKQGMTIFWQIDEDGKVRTGKMMRYYPANHPKAGHRDKESKYNFDFIHSILSRHRDPVTGEMTTDPPYPYPQLYDPDKQEMRQCYFGLHLIDAYKVQNVEQTVCIVESEKTALLMAIQYGNNAKQVWMACGGLENLTREKMKPIMLRGRNIVLYPDRDGIERWQKKADSIGYSRLSVDIKPVTEWWRPEDGEKADIADVVMRFVRTSKPMTTIDEVKAEMPKAENLIDKMNLTIERT